MAGVEAGNLLAPVQGIATPSIHKSSTKESRMAGLAVRNKDCYHLHSENKKLEYITLLNRELVFPNHAPEKKILADLLPVSKGQHLISVDKMYVACV